jgi:agmatinase
MSNFDSSVTASYKVGLFGIPTSRDKAKIVIIPVPWEVTTSYGSGASLGPETVWKASPQIDLFDLEVGRSYEQGYHLLPIPTAIQELNDQLKPKALKVRAALEDRGELTAALKKTLAEINAGCERMSEWVYKEAAAILKAGQIPAVLGGDHSSPEGNMRAVSEATGGEVGILHLDAHADLREQYQGFERSHASIMNNVIHATWKPKKLVQVAIRDFSQEEFTLIQKNDRIVTFFDLNLKRASFEGETWASICNRIIIDLPDQVYISFDIDGLSPEYCPSTGTPVPGGLSFDQANYLFRCVVESGRKIVGFDLNEVAPSGDPRDEWDGNVGSRLLYKLCGWTIKSQAGTGATRIEV